MFFSLIIKKKYRIFFLIFFSLLLLYLPIELVDFSMHHDDDRRWIDNILSNANSIKDYIDWIFMQVAAKFRPVTQLGYLISWKLSIINHNLIFLVNILMLSFASFILFLIYVEKENHDQIYENRYQKIILFLLISFAFATLRFHYYGIYNLAGLKEMLGLVISSLFLYLIIKQKFDLNKNSQYSIFINSLIIYNMLMYSHEIWLPFIFLLPAIKFFEFIFNITKINFKIFLFYLIPSVATLFLFIILKTLISNVIFVGLGPCPDLIHEFDPRRTFNQFGYSLQELMGFNGGPTYLNGDDYESAIKSWGKSRIPVYFFPLFLISCFIFFRNIYKNFKNPFFLGIFSIMLLSVLAASSTCRLEMRFFLPSSLLLFLILFYQKFNKLHEFKYKLLIIFILLQNLDYYTFGSNQMYYSTFYDKRPLIYIIKK